MHLLSRKFLLAIQVFIAALILLLVSHSKQIVYLNGDQFATVFISIVIAYLSGIGIQAWKFNRIFDLDQVIVLYDIRERISNLLSPGFFICSVIVWGLFFLFLKMPDIIGFGSWWSMSLAVLGLYEVGNPITKDMTGRTADTPYMDQ